MNMPEKGILNFNGKEYKIADLSKEAQEQVTNLRVCDVEIAQLKARLAIAETARSTYARALEMKLPKTES